MGTITDAVGDAKAWWQSKTWVGTILLVLPMILRMINPEWTVDLEAGTDAVFDQAEIIAGQADAIWVTISQSLGIILAALGLRNPNRRPIKKSLI